MGRYFDGASGNFLDAGDYAPTDFGAPITVFAWVRQDDITTERTVVGKHNATAARHWILRTNGVDRNGFFSVDAAGGGTGHESFSDTGTIRPYRWYPVTARITAAGGAEMSTWARGKKGSTTDIINNIHGTNSTAPMYIGKRSAATPASMKGIIAHVAIWQGSLSDREIVELHNGVHPLTIKRNLLVSYFPLDRGGASEPDIIGGGVATVTGSVPMAEGPSLPIIWLPTARVYALQEPLEDSATIYVDIQPSSADVADIGDAATVYLDLQPSGTELLVPPGPSNDNFANAVALSTSLPGNRLADTVENATFEASEVAEFPFSDETQSVWYTFTPTATGRYRFHVKLLDSPVVWQDTRQAVIALYSGSALGSLTKIVGVENSLAGPSVDDFGVHATLTNGVTYHLSIGAPLFTSETPEDHVFQFDLHWDGVPDDNPANDLIANPEDLGTDPIDDTYPGSTRGASTVEWGDPAVWYKFETTSAETQQFQVVRSDDYPEYYPYWELYEIIDDPPVDFSDLTFVDSGGDRDDPIADNSVLLSASTKYMLLVTTFWFNGSSDTFDLIFGAGPPPPPDPPENDIRADVTNLSAFDLAKSDWGNYFAWPHANQHEGTTIEATAEVGDPAIAGFAATRNVWYRASFLSVPRDVKIWVESAVDCVLAVYEVEFGSSVGTLIDEDDDSGAGNQPELTFTSDPSTVYWIIVDSKTEGDFTLKYQVVTGTPHPANDDFADAEVISALPFSMAGTTVNASAEPEESDAEGLGVGPTDSVWYVYTPSVNNQVKIKATCDTSTDDAYVYVDVWRGTTLANIARLPVPSGLRGFFNFFDTPAELEAQAIVHHFEAGQTYYIRVQTESGGSEDFTIYVEDAVVYLDLQASGPDEMHGTLLDDAEVYLNLQHSGVEVFDPALSLDSAEVYLNLTASGVEFKAFEYTDAATVLLNLDGFEEHECFFPLEPSFTANGIRKWQYDGKRKFSADGTRRWTWLEGEGLPQEC